MAEPPDFEQLGLIIWGRVPGSKLDEIAQVLRRVWNARGAADLEAIDATVTYTPSGIVRATRQQIERALRSVDR